MRVNIVNPLQCDGNMRRIIEIFFKTDSFDSFTTSIKNHISYKNYEENSIEKFTINQFSNVLFDYWKNQIINCNLDKFPYKKYNITESDLIYLKSYFISNEIITFEEYYISNNQNQRLLNIFDKFLYLNKEVEYSGINSYNFYIDQKFELNDEYIVTLNIKSRTLLFKVLTNYIKYCLNNKKTFKFKFSDTLNNDNTIIFYSDKNNLETLIKTLINIRKNDKELDALLSDCAKEPPLLYGVVDEWIGVRQLDDKYYDNRITCLYESIYDVMIDWYNDKFKTKNSQYTNMTYKDVIDEEIKRYFNYELNFLCLGTVKDFLIRRKLDKFVSNILESKYEDLDTYIFNVKKDVDIKLTKDSINRKIYELISIIYRQDKEFLDDIRNTIILNCKKYNIDSKRFYLDNDSSNILYAIYDETSLLDMENFIPSKEKVLNRNYK